MLKKVLAVKTDSCPCGSGTIYQDCCRPLHQGQPASSPETLMRSRFSAFALQISSYLLDSWHPETRPKLLELDPNTEWKRLEILSTKSDNSRGEVHFKATYYELDGWHLLEETSQFYLENNHWFYHSGDYQPQALTPNRNDSCPCGSQRKYKKCCL